MLVSVWPEGKTAQRVEGRTERWNDGTTVNWSAAPTAVAPYRRSALFRNPSFPGTNDPRGAGPPGAAVRRRTVASSRRLGGGPGRGASVASGPRQVVGTRSGGPLRRQRDERRRPDPVSPGGGRAADHRVRPGPLGHDPRLPLTRGGARVRRHRGRPRQHA